MIDLVPPHGRDILSPLLAEKSERAELKNKARDLTMVPMSSREKSDLLLLSMGAYTPLEGFMGELDWQGACQNMKLENGVFWPVPVTLSATSDLADRIRIGQEVVLVDTEEENLPMAVMKITEKYRPSHDAECTAVFGTADRAHPGVQKVMAQSPVNLAGRVTVFDEGKFPEIFSEIYVRPEESRKMFIDLGWSRVTAFQTRNPMHRSHEHLVKIAIDITDGVFIHQVLGKLKPGDIPADVRVNAIDALIRNYFAEGTAVQAGYPIEMRYAGPREALFHALIRQNYGCSHLIVGRDHAGVGNYYGPLDAQRIFDNLWEGALVTQPLKIDVTFYCIKCDGMVTAKNCPHGPEERIVISGTRQREMLTNKEEISTKFSRPEVVAVLREYYERLDD